jgi:hypothetical protein
MSTSDRHQRVGVVVMTGRPDAAIRDQLAVPGAEPKRQEVLLKRKPGFAASTGKQIAV